MPPPLVTHLSAPFAPSSFAMNTSGFDTLIAVPPKSVSPEKYPATTMSPTLSTEIA